MPITNDAASAPNAIEVQRRESFEGDSRLSSRSNLARANAILIFRGRPASRIRRLTLSVGIVSVTSIGRVSGFAERELAPVSFRNSATVVLVQLRHSAPARLK